MRDSGKIRLGALGAHKPKSAAFSPVLSSIVPIKLTTTEGGALSKVTSVEPKTIHAMRKLCGSALGWQKAALSRIPQACEAECYGRSVPITTDDYLSDVVILWRAREERRRVDALEALLAVTQSALASESQVYTCALEPARTTRRITTPCQSPTHVLRPAACR